MQFNRRQFLQTATCSLIATTTPISAMASRSGLSHIVHPQDISHLQVRKSQRLLDVISHEHRILKSYPIALGASPVGPKRFQGDMRTPEGLYNIARQNPQSQFYLSLGISYPNAKDIAYARANGRAPGGDIFIHGQPNGYNGTYRHDWTRGCIAVSNSDMTEIYRLIRIGCLIRIYA